MSIRRGRDYDYESGSDSDSDSDPDPAHDPISRHGQHSTTHPTPFTAAFATAHSASDASSSSSSSSSRDHHRRERILNRTRSQDQASEMGSWPSDARNSLDLYIDRRDGRSRYPHASNSPAEEEELSEPSSVETNTLERRRRGQEGAEMDRVRDGRMRDWLDGGTGRLQRIRSFDRTRRPGLGSLSRPLSHSHSRISPRRRQRSADREHNDDREQTRSQIEYSRQNPPNPWRRRNSNEIRRVQDDRHYRDVFARRDVAGEREWARYLRTGGDRDRLPERWRGWFR